MSIIELPPPVATTAYERISEARKQEEMAFIFSDVDLRTMKQVHEAWNPRELFNPGKLFPIPGRCVELKQL